MITNIVRFKVDNKEVRMRELSFLEYKQLYKTASGLPIDQMEELFDALIGEVVPNCPQLDAREKLIYLVNIRSVLHGNIATFTIGDTVVNITMDELLKKVPVFNEVVITSKYKKLFFKGPRFLYNSEFTSHRLASCLHKVKAFTEDTWEPNKNDTAEQVWEDIQKLNLPLDSVSAKVFAQIVNNPINILNTSLTFSNNQILKFLETLFFFEGLQTVYDIEYSVIKSLGLHADDLNTFTYPEIKMMLNRVVKENKDKNRSVEQQVA